MRYCDVVTIGTVFGILNLFLSLIALTLDLTHVFSGYIGSVSFINTILDVVSKLRAINPKLTYGETAENA